MPVSELLSRGLELMVQGMGTVFLFLAVLVFAVGRMSHFVQLYEKRHPTTEPASASMPVVSSGSDGELLAVISAAIHRYRTKS